MTKTIIIVLAILLCIIMVCSCRTVINDENIGKAEQIATLVPNSVSFTSVLDDLDYDATETMSVACSKATKGLWIRYNSEFIGVETNRHFQKLRIYDNCVYALEKIGGSWDTSGIIKYNFNTRKIQTVLGDCFCYNFEKTQKGLLVFIDASSKLQKRELETGLYLYKPNTESLDLIYSGWCSDFYSDDTSVWINASSEEDNITVLKIDLDNKGIEWQITVWKDPSLMYDWIPCGDHSIWVLINDYAKQTGCQVLCVHDNTVETVYQFKEGIIINEFAGNEKELYFAGFVKSTTKHKNSPSLIDIYRLDVETKTAVLYQSNVIYGKFYVMSDQLFLVGVKGTVRDH